MIDLTESEDSEPKPSEPDEPYTRRYPTLLMRPGLVTVLVVAAAAAVAASCSPAADPQASPIAEPQETSVVLDSLIKGSTRVETPPPPPGDSGQPDAMAFAEAEAIGPEATRSPTSTSTPAAADQTSPTTSGSGGAPVTTVGGGGGGGDTAIYLGLLGTLDRDDPVTEAAATPPAAANGILPLTGLPGPVPDRPAAVVKIDNSSPARPQTGLNSADIVVEEEVEGGVTRFAAVFHSTSSTVGPVRSGRTTDIGIINGLGSPLLLYSGANSVTDALLRAQPTIQNRSAATSSGYWRSSSRRAPSNLYTDTAPHWASATGSPPPPQFAYRADGEPVPGVDDTELTIGYRASSAAWSWDGTAWLRSQGGRAHQTASGQRVSAANIVVIEAREVATGMVDSTGATVPEFVFVGSGRATVFTAGKRIEGTWTRPTLASVATLTTAGGDVIELTPGRTWIELIRADAGMLG